MGKSRPFQYAQNRVTSWWKAQPPRWANGRAWRALSAEERKEAVATYSKSKVYREMKDLERKAEISKFIHVVATQGYPKAGREVGSQNATNEAKATSQNIQYKARWI